MQEIQHLQINGISSVLSYINPKFLSNKNITLFSAQDHPLDPRFFYYKGFCNLVILDIQGCNITDPTPFTHLI